MYYKILARIMGIFQHKRVKAWAFLGAFLIALSFCRVFKLYMGPLTPGEHPFALLFMNYFVIFI